MTWVRIDDEAREHPKLLAAGAEAAWLWTCALMYANHQKRRDGFIPAVVLPALYAPLAPKAKKLAAKLVEVGLLEQADGGYHIHDYRQYQPVNGAEVTEARREAGRRGGLRSGETRRSKPEADDEANAKQVASSKPEQPHRTTSHPVPAHPDHQGGRSEPVRLAPGASAEPLTPSDVDPEVRRITREQQYAEAYEAGIAAGKGGPYAMPTNQAGDLHRAILKFSEGRRDERLLNWIREAAADFAHDITRRAVTDPKIIDVHAAYAPRGFVRWLSTEERNAEAKAVGS